MVRVVALSGSGFRLSYFVGLLQGKRDARYSHCFGISGGALIATYLCKYRVGQEKEAVKEMNDCLDKYTSDDLMEQWPYPFPFNLYYFFRYKSWFSGRRMRELIQTEFTDEVIDQIRNSDRSLYIVYYSFATNRNEIMNPTQLFRKYPPSETDVSGINPYDMFRDILRASMSATGIFPCVEVPVIGVCSDAGFCEYVPVHETLAHVAQEHPNKKIEMDVFLSVERDNVDRRTPPNPSAFEILKLYPYQTMMNNIRLDLSSIRGYTQGQLSVCIYQPSQHIPIGVFDPDPYYMKVLQDLGEQDGQTSGKCIRQS